MTNKTRKSHVKGKVRSDIKFNGKTVLITGANQGIGYETALDLAGRGARVIMGCRDLQRAEEAKNKIVTQYPGAELVVRKLDLASLDSVRDFAKVVNENESRLDVLINNAGIMACPHWKTKEGYEMQLGVNHIGHFLLTNLLLDLLKRCAPSRIVILSSMAYMNGKMKWKDIMLEGKYDPGEAYGASKLANVHHCMELSERLKGTGVTCNCLHPGIVDTGLFDHFREGSGYCCLRAIAALCSPCLKTCVMITPSDGAQTSIYCAIAPELERVSGKYFDACEVKTLKPHAQSIEDRKKLWELSEEWTK